MDEHKEREILAAFVHGILAFGHALGVIHNHQKGNKKQTIIHASVFGYDLWSVWQHYKDIRRKK
jgi:hypothetical protein